jgi:hypothetical protein
VLSKVKFTNSVRDVKQTRENKKDVNAKESSTIHRKKRFTSFPSPAGMSLTKLLLGRNNSVMTSLFSPRESLVVTSRLGTGNFYGVYYRAASVQIFKDDVNSFPSTSDIFFMYKGYWAI